MKFITAILATLTLFMTVQPVLTHNSYVAEQKENCTKDNCCSDDKETCDTQNKVADKQDPDKCCNNGHCNPFEVCACCYYTSIGRPVFNFANPFILTIKKPRLADENILSSFIADCWHPPEFI